MYQSDPASNVSAANSSLPSQLAYYTKLTRSVGTEAPRRLPTRCGWR
jgi:hypothetical protein